MSKLNYFNTFEKFLWSISVILLTLSFFTTDSHSPLALISSLIGVTALIFLAKGNALGQILTIVFSIFYGILSFNQSYYGEMVTYLGMTAPAALVATISWLKNPFKSRKSEVKIADLTKAKILKIAVLNIIVTFIFYFILEYFGTAYLLISTLSVSTSFTAVALTYYRSEFYAPAYALNDLVLITLWTLASFEESSHFTTVICFIIFFVNDLYGFFNWRKIKKRQKKEINKH